MTKMLSICFECGDKGNDDAVLLVFPGSSDQDCKILNGIIGADAVNIYKTLIGENSKEKAN